MTQADLTETEMTPNIQQEEQCIAILPTTGARAKAELVRGGSNKGDPRRPGRRDRDKIMYTSQWRRLAHVTQVISPDGEDALVHTRLTHSEKVAQVAWSIGNKLFCDATNTGSAARERIAYYGGLDLDMVEAAALAHDLGHPPFGHLGESVLDRFAREVLDLQDGFEGNAQTLRVLASLSRWSPGDRGLNLTNGTYAAVLKYPWERELTDTTSSRWIKFGAYRTEAPLLRRVRQWQPDQFHLGGPYEYCQSVEANVMDLADDITYAVHDFEDFVVSGIVDSKHLIQDLKDAVASLRKQTPDPTWFGQAREQLSKKYPDIYDPLEFNSALEALHTSFPGFVSSADGEETERKGTAITSGLLTRYIDAVEVLDKPQWDGGPFVAMTGKQWHHMQLLKAVTQDYVIQSPAVAMQQRAEKSMLQGLCEAVLLWATEDPTRLPSSLRARITLSSQPGCNQALWNAVNRGLIQPNRQRVDRIRDLVPCPPERHIIDFLAGLTDRSARSLYFRLVGGASEQIAPYALF